MAYDVQVLVQSLIYLVIVLFGLVVAVPLGVTVVEFDNHCILYAKWNWVNATYATLDLTNHAVCNFSVFMAVLTCILYSLAMGIYHAYAALRSKDPNIGFQMWIMPFILVNTVILVLMFVSCCITSVGLKTLCDGIMEGKKKGAKIDTCSDAANYNWNVWWKTDYTYSHFYSYPKTSEVAGWLTFLLWGTQYGFCILRFIRNRRLRSKGMEPQIESTAVPGLNTAPKDLESFASVEPSA